VQPPAYTGVPADTLRYPFAQITGAQGAELKLMASFNKPLSMIEFYRGDSVALVKDASMLELETKPSWIPPNSLISIYATQLITHDTLAINLLDSSGLQSNEDHASMLQIVLQPVPDLAPIVELLEPAQNLQEVAPEQLSIMYRASDDYGLRRAQLVYELKRAFRPEQAPVIIPLGPAKSNDLNIYDWPLSELDLRPKDELRFRVEVFDNDGFNGSKVGRSETRVLLVPSL
ncbi:MAG: DUF4175 family protein, partial [Bacteroidota bacterium]